jgi:hypothetical protein
MLIESKVIILNRLVLMIFLQKEIRDAIDVTNPLMTAAILFISNAII